MREHLRKVPVVMTVVVFSEVSVMSDSRKIILI